MKAHVWIGPAGCGKTARCLASLRDAERARRPACLIVPDQFTYTADRLILEDCTLPGTRFVRVASFRRLAHLVAAQFSPDSPVASPQAQRLLLRGIVQALPPDALGPLAQLRNAPGFVEALAAFIREVKAVAGTTAAVSLAEAAAGDPKASALLVLLRAYDDAIARAGMRDSGEWHHDLARQLISHPGKWAGQQLFVDGFMSFTADERTLLRALVSVSSQATITLCADPQDARLALARAGQESACGCSPLSAAFMSGLRPQLARPQFLPALRTLMWLADVFLDALEPEWLTAQHRFSGPSQLSRLEKELFRESPGENAEREEAGPIATQSAEPPAITFRNLPSPYHEVRHWARLIVDWTRHSPSPARYRDIAVMVRDLEIYRPLVIDAFAEHEIPLFVDQRRDATAHPLVRLLFAALRMAAQGWTRTAVVAALRNPILRLTADEVDRIENLSLEYGIEYERWYETDWQVLTIPNREAQPDEESVSNGEEDSGDDESEPRDGSEDELTDVLPNVRDAALERRRLAAISAREIARRAFPPLLRFTNLWRGSEPRFSAAAEGVSALMALTDGLDFADWTESETGQVHELVAEAMSAGTRLMGDVPVGAGLMARLVRDALAGASIGLVPQALDAVTVAEIRRSRVDERRRIILGGLDAGAFPHVHPEDPFFSDVERERLAEKGLRLGGSASAASEEEAFLFYIGCTRAREQLVLTSSAAADDGSEQLPSPFLREIEKATGAELERIEPGELPRRDAGASLLIDCYHPHEAVAALASVGSRLAPDSAANFLSEARAALPGADDLIATAEGMSERLRPPGPERLPEEVLAVAYPSGVLATSASGLEAFARCPFQHFARSLLRLEPRPTAILTPLSTGSAAHAALERFFSAEQLPPDVASAESEILRIFGQLAKEDEFRIFQIDPPSSYRWERTGRNLRLFVRAEWKRLHESAYQPHELELSFGLSPEGLRPLEIAIAPPAGCAAGPALWTVRLRGRIDRLDVAPGERALVIDYKHSLRQQSIADDLAKGVRLQAAIYLLVVRELLHLEPAGAVYYSVSPRPRTIGEEVKSKDNPLRFSMRGFVLASEKDAIDPERGFLPPRGSEGEVLDGAAALGSVLEKARQQIADISAEILGGNIRCEPLAERAGLPCAHCDFRDVCRFDPLRHPRRRWERRP